MSNHSNTSQHNKPVAVIRDGNLQASIWENENDKGTYYSTTYSKSYKDDRGDYQNSQRFIGTDHLKLSELSKQAYQKERELYDRDRQSSRKARSRDRGDDRDR